MDGAPTPLDPKRMTPIGRLINTLREGPPRVPLREMEKRAAEKGHPVSKGTFNAWAKEHKTHLPEPNTWHALAAGLNVPLGIVTDALLETFGLQQSREPITRWTIISERASALPKSRADELARRVDSWFSEFGV